MTDTVETINGETRDAQEPSRIDIQEGVHMVSGRGVFCPERELIYEPEKGDGNTCQLCGHENA